MESETKEREREKKGKTYHTLPKAEKVGVEEERLLNGKSETKSKVQILSNGIKRCKRRGKKNEEGGKTRREE